MSTNGGDATNGNDAASFVPGSVVRAKLKGYPWWPGMVVDETVISSEVLKAKPKPSNKKGASDQHWPVRFFNDVNYMWAAKGEIKPLSSQEALDFVAQKGKNKTLLQAYRIAADPPSLDDLISDAPAEPAAEPEADAAPKPKVKAKAKADPAAKPVKRKKPEKAVEESADSEANDEPAPTKSKLVKSVSSTSASPAPTSTKLKKSRLSSPMPSAKELAKSSVYRTNLSLAVRHKLQKGFLSKGPPTEDDIPALSDYLTKLEDIPNLELSIIRQTKVNKVLKAILNIKPEDIPLETKYKFQERSYQLLTRWNNMSSGPAPKIEPDDEADGVAAVSQTKTEPSVPEPEETAAPEPAVPEPAPESEPASEKIEEKEPEKAAKAVEI